MELSGAFCLYFPSRLSCQRVKHGSVYLSREGAAPKTGLMAAGKTSLLPERARRGRAVLFLSRTSESTRSPPRPFPLPSEKVGYRGGGGENTLSRSKAVCVLISGLRISAGKLINLNAKAFPEGAPSISSRVFEFRVV